MTYKHKGVKQLSKFLEGIRHFIFDVDGTLLLGKQSLPFAREVIKLLQEQQLDFTILSNNSSYSIEENLARLENVLEVELKPENIYTSTHATIDYLLKNEITSCYILGTPGMRKDLEKKGVKNNSENPQAIVLGFDKTLDYEKIQRTALLLQNEERIPFFATHSDNTCPTEEGDIPDVGSFLKMFEQATGRTADIIFGKPNEIMLKLCLSRTNVDFSEVLVIGDRVETDIRMASSVGVKSVLVLTGETRLTDLENNTISPTKIWANLEELYNFLS